jgi:hypothetical protein
MERLMIQGATLYFHYPCFDGLTSAVLALDFLEESQHWKFDELIPVNYEHRRSWLTEKRNSPFAVVDFLYHPNAEFWADHHQTSFLAPTLKQRFHEQHNPYHIYNSKSGSCANLLWRTLLSRFGYRNPRFTELVKWAHRIDSAQYRSVKEAISGQYAALNINRTLAINKDPSYPAWLVTQLRTRPLSEVARLPEVLEKSNEARKLIKAGLDRLSATVHLNGQDIVVFDVDSSDVLINRYAPYHFFPKARYSLGMVRTPDGVKITAMRNPWREFPSIYLGKVFEKFGGGGHRRVGSVLLKDSDARKAENLMKRLLREIRKEESTNSKSVAA